MKLVQDNIQKIVNFTPAKTLNQVYGLIDENLEKRRKSYLSDEAYLIPDEEVKPVDLDPIFEPALK